jgi:hypothetical protein
MDVIKTNATQADDQIGQDKSVSNIKLSEAQLKEVMDNVDTMNRETSSLGRVS